MSHKTAFALLFAIILLLGYYSVDIAGLFTDSSGLKQTKIERDASASGAIYISSGKDINFDPMSILEISDQTGDDSVENDGRRINDYYPAGFVCENMLICMSRYCKETEFGTPVGKPISEELKLSLNDYLYLEKYEYYNRIGELRYLDCIISLEDYRVVYIRFYSQDNEVAPGSDKIESALSDLNLYSKEFYSPEWLWQGALGYILGRAYESLQYSQDVVEVYWDYPNEGIEKYLETKFYAVSEVVSESKTDSPLLDFWLKTAAASIVDFIDYDGSNKGVNGVTYIFWDIQDNRRAISPTYSVYKNSLYQSIYLGDRRVITIYNIEGGYVEGFYAEPISSDEEYE